MRISKFNLWLISLKLVVRLKKILTNEVVTYNKSRKTILFPFVNKRKFLLFN